MGKTSDRRSYNIIRRLVKSKNFARESANLPLALNLGPIGNWKFAEFLSNLYMYNVGLLENTKIFWDTHYFIKSTI